MQAGVGRTATLFPLLIAGLLAAMTFWLEHASRPPAGASDGKSRHDPDYIVEKFEVRRFDPDGALQHTLRAVTMRHYPDDDSTIVEAPDLTYHRVPPTHVTARTARIGEEGKHVQLIDDVRVTRGSVEGKPDTILTTSRLDAYPDDEIATSNRPVTISQGLTVVNGSGLNANNKSAIYVLEGPVRGIFHRDGGLPAAASPSPGEPLAKPTAPAAKPKPRPGSKAKVKTPPKPTTKRKPTR